MDKLGGADPDACCAPAADALFFPPDEPAEKEAVRVPDVGT
jgi:hypothetical protein